MSLDNSHLMDDDRRKVLSQLRGKVGQSLERAVRPIRGDRDHVPKDVPSVGAHVDTNRVTTQESAHDFERLSVVRGIPVVQEGRSQPVDCSLVESVER
jgi:hypothetical protein